VSFLARGVFSLSLSLSFSLARARSSSSIIGRENAESETHPEHFLHLSFSLVVLRASLRGSLNRTPASAQKLVHCFYCGDERHKNPLLLRTLPLNSGANMFIETVAESRLFRPARNGGVNISNLQSRIDNRDSAMAASNAGERSDRPR